MFTDYTVRNHVHCTFREEVEKIRLQSDRMNLTLGLHAATKINSPVAGTEINWPESLTLVRAPQSTAHRKIEAALVLQIVKTPV